ncbi:hypothetical protein [Paenibacillus sacheonensis]|uniref:Uncharacterized protein n=1 Tax=Paenibacillus sacheonensis TaxID=742054 RepID=A0A7X5C279_9BACL|nr:hypothetical protein [Paenibacillus sacheonensis]MBM7569518.1 hypothetical protein [Paenibacillus sacheonensis]NBC73577.1 hypothetical protein [Paenibacillus sacheonensis]
MRRVLCLFVFVGLLLVGCSEDGFEMPEEVPNDFAFSISFGVGSKNKINTYDGIVIKDLIIDGTATAELYFTKDETFRIYQRMREQDILQSPSIIGNTTCNSEPYGMDQWRIRVNGNEKTIKYCDDVRDAKNLVELRNFIFEIVKHKDEYEKLPETVGGYE